MRANVAALCCSLFFGATVCLAQEAAPTPIINSTQNAATATQPDTTAVYCSGFITDQSVPDTLRVISAEQSNYKVIFGTGDYIHINRGSSQGARVGDRLSVVRASSDPLQRTWFQWQTKLMKAMGTHYSDIGVVQIVNVQPNVSVAKVVFSCIPMWRGDILRPYEDRPVSLYKPASQFDHFAPVSGKPVAMIVEGNGTSQIAGMNSTVYVNLGTGKGVKIGDYFRIFRYQGSTSEVAPVTKDYQYKIFGFGSAPQRYVWKDLPREVLGEGIVLNVSTNSSTIFITYTTAEVYAGDYVELE
ncbi:MAG: hypothetical protein PVS2B2_16590 [Candidatus Acidiferrum sp.]